MNSAEYWAKRAEERMLDYMRSAAHTGAEISRIYYKAARYIEDQVKSVFKNFQGDMSEAEARRLLKKAEAGTDYIKSIKKSLQKAGSDEEKQRLISMLNAPAYKARIARWKELNERLEQICQEIYRSELVASERLYEELVEEGYYRQIFDVQKGLGYTFSFASMDEKKIDRILSQKWSGEHFSKRIWNNTQYLAQTVKEELAVTFMTGRSYAKTADILVERFGVGAMAAQRLVRTEANHAANQGELAAYAEEGVKRYEYIGTLDIRACSSCGALDGRIFEVSKARAGENFPTLHPNCRCTTAAIFDDENISALHRRARNPITGKNELIPTDMTYEEWRKSIDAKYGEGTWETERKKAINKKRDKAQFTKYKEIVGTKNIPSSLVKFQEMKYNNKEGWGKLIRNKKLFEKIDNTDSYSATYKEKLKETYQFFKDNGYEFTEHGINRVVGQKTKNKKQTFTKEKALEILRKEPNYIQGDGKYVKFYQNIAVVQAADTGEVISVIWRENIRPDWKEV